MNSVGIGCCGQKLSVDHPYPVGWVGDGQGRGRPDQAGGYAAWSCGGLGSVAGLAVRYWSPRRSRSWHSLHLSARLPSGASILSLPHSQVRSRISNARSSFRERLASGLQCSAMMESYLWEKRA